jgi:hypothetical protein
VTGIAVCGDPFRYGDEQRIVDIKWAAKEMRRYTKEYGQVYLQHDQKRPVGKIVSCERQDSKAIVTTRITDRDAKKLIKRGVLTGFSIGMSADEPRYTKKGMKVDDGEIFDLSIVDAPGMPECKILTFAKPRKKSKAGKLPEWVKQPEPVFLMPIVKSVKPAITKAQQMHADLVQFHTWFTAALKDSDNPRDREAYRDC